MKKSLAIVAVSSMATLALYGCAKKSDTTMTDTAAHSGTAVVASDASTKNVEGLRKFYAAVNARDTATMRSLMASNFTDHNPDPGQTNTGPDGVIAGLSQFWTAFPDMKLDVQDVVASGDEAAARVALSGTNKGNFMGMKPTNKSFKADMIEIIKMKDGKATDRWGQFDAMAMMGQLGMMPPMAPPKK